MSSNKGVFSVRLIKKNKLNTSFDPGSNNITSRDFHVEREAARQQKNKEETAKRMADLIKNTKKAFPFSITLNLWATSNKRLRDTIITHAKNNNVFTEKELEEGIVVNFERNTKIGYYDTEPSMLKGSIPYKMYVKNRSKEFVIAGTLDYQSSLTKKNTRVKDVTYRISGEAYNSKNAPKPSKEFSKAEAAAWEKFKKDIVGPTNRSFIKYQTNSMEYFFKNNYIKKYKFNSRNIVLTDGVTDADPNKDQEGDKRTGSLVIYRKYHKKSTKCKVHVTFVKTNYRLYDTVVVTHVEEL